MHGLTPHRVQLSRAKGWRMPANTVKVDRSTRWGNPYRVGDIIADPVNHHNAIAAPALHSMSTGTPLPILGRFLRTGFGGVTYVQVVREIADAADAVALFRRLCEFEGYNLTPLRGKNLACWCPLDQPCHADVLLRLANGDDQ